MGLGAEGVLKAKTFFDQVLPEFTRLPAGEEKSPDRQDDLKSRPDELSVLEAMDRISGGVDRHLPGVPIDLIAGTTVLKIDYLESLTSAEQIQAVLKKCGVRSLDVLGQYGPVDVKALELEDTATSRDYLNYALANYSQFHGELQKVLGPFPLRPNGDLPPDLVQRYQAIQSQLNSDDPRVSHLEKLLDPKTSAREKLEAYFQITVQEKALFAQALLNDAGKAGDSSRTQKAVEEFALAQEKLWELAPHAVDAVQVALGLFQAGGMTRELGQEAKAKEFYRRGIEILRGSEGIKKNGILLKILGDGLQAIGEYQDAVQAYDQALNTGVPKGDLTREEWFSQSQAFENSLVAPTVYCLRQAEVQRHLPKDFLKRLEELEEKQTKAALSPKEAKELRDKKKGLELLARIQGLRIPTPDRLEENKADLPPFLKGTQKDVLAALHGDESAGNFKSLEEKVEKFEAAERTLAAIEVSRQNLLKEFPPYVQEYVKSTGDWSVIRLDYSDAPDLPKHWNPEHLQGLRLLKGFRKLQKEQPEQAAKIAQIMGLFSQKDLVPSGLKDGEDFVAWVAKLEGQIFQVMQHPLTGKKILAAAPELETLYFEAHELELDTEPEAWLGQSLQRSQTELRDLENLIRGWESRKQEIGRLQAELKQAEARGNEAEAKRLCAELELQKRQWTRHEKKTQEFYQAKVKQFENEVTRYQRHFHSLELDPKGRIAFQGELQAAHNHLNAPLQRIPFEKGPKELLMKLAGAEAQLLKAKLFVYGGIQKGELGEIRYHGIDLWEQNMDEVGEAISLSELNSLDAAQIDQVLLGARKFLKDANSNSNEDTQERLKNLIETQKAHWYQVAHQMDRHAAESGGAERIASLFADAEKALKGGNTQGAWSLYQKAVDSKLYQEAIEDHQELLDKIKWEERIIHVSIVAAAGLVAYGSAGILAPEAVAAGSWAATALEGVLFYGAEIGISSALYHGIDFGHNPLKDEHGRWLDVGDHAFGTVQSIGALGAVKKSLKLFNRGFLRTGIAAQLGEGELVALAKQTGKAVSQLTEAEILAARMAKMGILGKGAYYTGAFTTEFGGLQVWNNMGATLHVLYQNLRHDRDLIWKEVIAQANSLEALEDGALFLAGLKIANGATRGLHELAGSRVQSRALQLKIQNFEKLSKALEGKIAREGGVDVKNLALAKRYLEMGDQIYLQASLLDGVSPQAKEDWLKARGLLAEGVSAVELSQQLKQALRRYDAKVAREKSEAEGKAETPKGQPTVSSSTGSADGWGLPLLEWANQRAFEIGSAVFGMGLTADFVREKPILGALTILGFATAGALGMVFSGRGKGEGAKTKAFTPKIAEPVSQNGFWGPDVKLSAEQFSSLMGQVPTEAKVRKGEGDLHITLLGPADAKALVDLEIQNNPGLSKSKAQKIVKEKMGNLPAPQGQPKVTGIGSATDAKDGHTVYYATLEWPEAQAFRKSLGLGEKDLHVTLASTESQADQKTGEPNGKPKDVHGVAKNEPNVVRFSAAEGAVESRAGTEATSTDLATNEAYQGFRQIEVTAIDESKPWKPPLKVKVTKADGSVEEIAANTPFFTFVTPDGKKLTVSAANAGHIDKIHLKAKDGGSVFYYSSVGELMADIAKRLPATEAATPGVSVLEVEMGKPIGKEGLSTLAELQEAGVISQGDIAIAEKFRQEVYRLNREGSAEEKQAFAEQFGTEHPDCKIQFKVMRDGKVLVPVVDTPLRETQKIYMVFGPGESGDKTLWTAAPGRKMPPHPIPGELVGIAEGELKTRGIETSPENVQKRVAEKFQESADAWFETVMLVPSPKPEGPKGPQGESNKGSGENSKKPQNRKSPLEGLKGKAKEILDHVPADKKAEAQREIDAAFAGVPEGADAKELGRILGPKLGRIEENYVPEALQTKNRKARAREADQEAKAARKEAEAVEKLKEMEVWTQEIEAEFNEFRSFNGSEKKIRHALSMAAGESDPVAAYNKLRGLLFEISRNKKFAEEMQVDPSQAPTDSKQTVKYHGVKRGKAGLEVGVRESTIENDGFVLNGQGQILETKHYSRRNFGIEDDGGMDTALLNQAAKYNEALTAPNSPYRSASIEITGNVDSFFLGELAKRAPEVEILYCYTLPSGAEIVFRLKAGGEDRPSLKRWPDMKTLPEGDQAVADGLHKVLKSGRLLKDGILQNDYLKLKDIPEDHPHYENMKAATKEDGSIDPYQIKDLKVFQEWERLLDQKRVRYFEEQSHRSPLRRSTEHLTQAVTEEAVDRYLAEVDGFLENAPVHTRTQYQLTDPAQKAQAREEFKKRLIAIQAYEQARMNSPEAEAAHAKRREMGYTGPEEGYVLDVTHIYQDVVKGIKEEAKKAQEGQKKKKGKSPEEKTELPFGVTEPLPARSYDKAESILRGEQVLEHLLSPESKFNKENEFVRVVYPENVDPDVGEQVTNAKVFDITDPKDLSKLQDALHQRNWGRLKDLKGKILKMNSPGKSQELPEGERRLIGQVLGALAKNSNRQKIKMAEDQLNSILQNRNEEFARIDQDPSIPNNQKGRKKGEVSVKYKDSTRAAEEGVFEAWERALGPDLYRKLFEYVQERWKSDEIKFIYTIDSEGTLRMVQEDLKPGSERPAHSQLSGGRNVYAAGQVWVKGKPVLGPDGKYRIQINVIDDGSGHYRPGTFDMLPYAQKVFEAAGFDVGKTEFKHAPLPFVTLGEDFDVEVKPWE